MPSIGSLIFQEKLINFVLTSKAPIRYELVPMLKVEYFESHKLQTIVRHLLAYFDEHHAIEPLDYMIGQVDEEVGAYITKITTKKLYYGEEEDVKNKTREFVRKQDVRGVITDISDCFSQVTYDEIRTKLNESMMRCEIGDDKDVDVRKDFESLAQLAKRECIQTGWRNIDCLLGGGVAAGEIAMAAASAGIGKSMLLVGRTCEAQRTFTEEKDCAVYFTCELADHIVAYRCVACLTDIPFNNLRDNEEERKRAKHMLAKYKGCIKVKEYPSGTATVSQLRGYLEKLRAQGFNIKFIAVDYPEEMAVNVMNLRLSVASLYRQLRALAHKTAFNCPVWTVSQLNRVSSNEDIITAQGLAECWAKAGIVDVMFGLSKSHMVLIKNRAAGIDHLVFDVDIETPTASITVAGKGIPLGELMQQKGVDEGEFQKHLQREARRLQEERHKNEEDVE